MASTDVDVFTKALLLLRLSGITSFEDEGADVGKAAWGGEHYEQTKWALIDEYPWRCFMTKASLNRDTVGPENEYTYSFQLPADVRGAAFALFISGEDGASPVTDGWEVFGRKIFSNFTAVWIDYKADKLEAEMPAYFIQMLIFELAWMAAATLTGDLKKAEYWRMIARGAPVEQGKGGYFRIASQSDAMMTTPQQFVGFTLVEARFGLG